MSARRLLLPSILLALLAGCASSDRERRGLLAETLAERAPRLAAAQRARLVDAVVRAEAETQVDALLLLAVIEQESHFRPKARGPRGAVGLMQVQPATGREVAHKAGVRWPGEGALTDPHFNVRIGAHYLRDLRRRFGSWDLALTAYNRGPAKARRLRATGKRSSSRYASRVLERYEALTGLDREALEE